METRVVLPTDENILFAGQQIIAGEIVAMPTETVYGLAANVYNSEAVKKIFVAKGRPQDNPLIVHICNISMLSPLVQSIPPIAKQLAEKFWPGPLTIIFRKSDSVPLSVTAGLDTVAIRFPSHKVALRLIESAGVPLAAPSANSSGRQSPTTANHVFTDLDGKIPTIIDGGSCEVGLESTVIKLDYDGITLLRPGAVTFEMLSLVVPNVRIDEGVLNEVSEDEIVSSPGMKHKHYAPLTKVCIIDSDLDQFVKFIQQHADQNIGALVFDNEDSLISVPTVTFGEEGDNIIQAKLLFSALRAIDDLGVDKIYARMPDKHDVGLAIYNRLVRAAGFEVITL